MITDAKLEVCIGGIKDGLEANSIRLRVRNAIEREFGREISSDIEVSVVGVTEAPATYTCPKCGKTSHNPHDAVNRYCGNCHQYEDEQCSGPKQPPTQVSHTGPCTIQ
jgi:hypothetical protein